MLTPVVGNAQDFSYIDTKMDSVMDLPQWSRDVDCSNYDYATTIPWSTGLCLAGFSRC